MNKAIKDVVIRFSGDSGDGMQLTGMLFSDASSQEGNSISTFPDFPSEIRAPQGTVAGVSGFQVHLGGVPVLTPGDYCDVLVAMNPAALKANARWLTKDATIICDADNFSLKSVQKAAFQTDDPFVELGLEGYNIVMCPIGSMTKDALVDSGLDAKSVSKCKNMFALGVCYYLFDRPTSHTFEYFDRKFAKRPAIAQANKTVLTAGINYASNSHIFANTFKLDKAPQQKGRYRSITGNTATAWGLIAASEKSGRPLFCGSYPITPATAILEELAKRKDLGVKTLQAEDEIAGICTSIGAAFAGNFAVTTTSGPGLSLKSEALGLAVMTELPLVIVDVQRGGPSTGLPTKTEQADLAQALWGRNGECPMVVMAASTPSGCFESAFMAGKIAMEHMTPVLLLTDGFIANGSEPWRIPAMADFPSITPPMVTEKPEGGYQPYKRDAERLARSWALPGTVGLEHRIGGLEKHCTSGTVSHDPDNHQLMVETRAQKVEKVAEFMPQQTVYGDQSGEVLVVGWGGTFGHLRTAVDAMREKGLSVSHCHVELICPLPLGLKEIFQNFKHIVVCELNMGQFANYLRMNLQEFQYHQLNKVQGLPFTVEEITQKVNSLL